jgi:peptide/nickel transport system substrate-binding protein
MHWVEGGGAFYLFNQIYQPLVGASASGRLVPLLAESWDVSPDAKTYTFHLRHNVKWHDGVKFSSADVKFTYEAIVTKNLLGASYFAGVESIETPDDYTAVFHLKNSDGAFPYMLGAWTNWAVVAPKHLLEGYDDWMKAPIARSPVGTGPFKFVDWTTEYFTLEANPDYFLGRPYLDKIVQRTVNNLPAGYMAIEGGEGNHMYEPPPYTDVARWKTVKGVTVHTVPAGAENALTLNFNEKRKPFDNVKVRQAFLYAIDRNDVNIRAFAGVGRPAHGPYCPSTFWAADPNVKYPDYDPATAETLLEEAGLKKGPDGTRLKLRFLVHTLWGEMEVAATVIREQLKKAGIDVQGIDLIDWVSWLDLKARGEFDATFDIDYMVPDPSTFSLYYAQGAFYRASILGYSNPRVDELLTLGVSSAEREVRKGYYSELQKILAQDVPKIYLGERWFVFVTSSQYHNFYWEPQVDSYRFDFSRVWWEGGAPPS